MTEPHATTEPKAWLEIEVKDKDGHVKERRVVPAVPVPPELLPPEKE